MTSRIFFPLVHEGGNVIVWRSGIILKIAVDNKTRADHVMKPDLISNKADHFLIIVLGTHASRGLN